VRFHHENLQVAVLSINQSIYYKHTLNVHGACIITDKQNNGYTSSNKQ